MKTRRMTPITLAAALAALSAVGAVAQEASPAQQSAALYKQGMAAEQAGDAAGARQAYEQALKLNPRNANARYRLGQVRTHHAKSAAKGRESKFSSVVIPEFKVDDATLGEALGALSQLTGQASKEAVVPNFIVQDSSGELAARKVTLVMKSAPAGGVLRYLLEMAGAKARFDEHAIVVLPR